MTTLTVDQARQLNQDGFLILPGLIPSSRIAQMRAKLDEILEQTEQDHAGTLIAGNLMDHAVFDAAWNQPLVLAAAREILAAEFLITGLISRGLRPGHGQQALHVDWGGQGLPGTWYACHAICALVDFTTENGATRVVPGSHLNPRMMRSQRDPRIRPKFS